MTFDEAKEILAALEREGVEYILVGSMAMAAQGIPRATQDIDLFVSPEKENIERLKRALFSLFNDPSIQEIDAEELAGAYPVVQYVPPHRRYSIDILTRLGEAFCYQDLEYEEFTIEAISVRVATPKTLYLMKKNTVRPQDRIDAERIKATFKWEED